MLLHDWILLHRTQVILIPSQDLAGPLIDGILDLWSDTFGRLLPAAFRDLKVKTAQVIYELSDETERRMQPNLTESARMKLRLQARAQIESIHEAIDGMRTSLIGSDNRSHMRNQIAPGLERGMTQAWEECVRTTGRSFPCYTRHLLHTRKAN